MKTGLHDCIKNEDWEASSWSKLIASQTRPQKPKQNPHAIQKTLINGIICEILMLQGTTAYNPSKFVDFTKLYRNKMMFSISCDILIY